MSRVSIDKTLFFFLNLDGRGWSVAMGEIDHIRMAPSGAGENIGEIGGAYPLSITRAATSSVFENTLSVA